MTDPLGLKFGKIVGRFLANTADGVDSDDLPEFEPLSGTVTIKAEPPKILVPQGDPDPATVVQLPDHYICTLDNQGYLTNQGERGVKVIAPTPGTTNPDTFTYKAIFDLYYGTQRVKITPFSFHVTEYTPGPNPADPDAGSVGLTDLTKVSPVPGSLGNAVTAGVSVVDVDIVGDALVFTLSDGSSLPPVTVPAITAATDAADAAAASATAADNSADDAAAAVNSFTLVVGTVTTVPYGTPASASVHGGPPAWTVDLVLPQGPTGSGAPDATASVKGLVQLTGDLGGTAASPTVPGLAGKAPTVHTHTASQISDSTTVGRSVLTAADATAARTAIGAGTSNLAIGTTGTTAAAGNDARLSDTRTPSANTVPADFLFVLTSPATTRAVGTGDWTTGMYVGRAFTLTKCVWQFETADASGSTTVEVRRNGTAVTSSSITVTAVNQADGTGTDAARTATVSQSFAVGDRLLPAITAIGNTPGKGAKVYLFGTWN